MVTQQQRTIIKQVLAPFCPQRIGVFGSVARNEATAQSDLDILVHFNNRLSLFDLMEIEDQLRHDLQQKVDLITEHALHPAIKESIKQDVVYL